MKISNSGFFLPFSRSFLKDQGETFTQMQFSTTYILWCSGWRLAARRLWVWLPCVLVSPVSSHWADWSARMRSLVCPIAIRALPQLSKNFYELFSRWLMRWVQCIKSSQTKSYNIKLPAGWKNRAKWGWVPKLFINYSRREKVLQGWICVLLGTNLRSCQVRIVFGIRLWLKRADRVCGGKKRKEDASCGVWGETVSNP